MPEEKPRPGLARLHRDPMLARLQDLDRLRDLSEPYITDSRANVQENALPHMPRPSAPKPRRSLPGPAHLSTPPRSRSCSNSCSA